MKVMNASTLFGEEPLISDEFRNRYSNLFKQTDFQEAANVTVLRRSVDRHWKTAPITYLTKPMSDCASQTMSVKIVRKDNGKGMMENHYRVTQEDLIRITKPTYSDKVDGVCRIQERFMNGEHADGETSDTNRNCIISVTRYRQAFPALKINGDDGTTHRDILLCVRLKLSDINTLNVIDDLPNTAEDGKHSSKYTINSSMKTAGTRWRTSEKLDARMILMMRVHVSDDILKTDNTKPWLTSENTSLFHEREFSLERKQSSEGVRKNIYGNGTLLENVITKRTSPNTVVFGGPVNVQYDDLSLRLTEGVYIVNGKIPTDTRVNVVNARYQNL